MNPDLASQASSDISRVLESARAHLPESGSRGYETSTVERVYSLVFACHNRWLPCPTYHPEFDEEGNKLFEIDRLCGRLEALRADYDAGQIQTMQELVHGNLFADFLEMAEHLLENNYKDAAAVIIGSTLEEHLRKLCVKNGIPTVRADGKSKLMNDLNQELRAQNVYGANENKMVTAWAGIRNSAAHGKYAEFTLADVTHMLGGVKLFLSKYPA